MKSLQTRRITQSLAVGLALGVTGIQLAAEPAKPVAPARPSAASAAAQFRGFVLPSRQVVLVAPLEGILERVEVKEGDRVQNGQALLQMDDRLQQVVVESARLKAESRSELQRIEAARDEAQVNFDRVHEAYNAKAASESEFRRTKLQLSQAEAALNEAKDNLALAQSNLKLEERRLSQFKLLAPFSGHVVRVQVEAGAMVTRNDKLLILAHLDELEAHVHLPAELYGQLQLGKEYQLQAESPVDHSLTGKLKTIDPVIDTASQTFRCVFTIANEGVKLPAGFTVLLNWPQ